MPSLPFRSNSVELHLNLKPRVQIVCRFYVNACVCSDCRVPNFLHRNIRNWLIQCATIVMMIPFSLELVPLIVRTCFSSHTHTHNQAKSKKGGGPHDKNHMNDNPSVGISTNIILIVIL